MTEGTYLLNNNTSLDFTTELQVKAKTDLTNNILEEAANYLKGSQVLELNKTLNKHFERYEIFVEQSSNLHENYAEENKAIVNIYLQNKKLEGLSPRTLTAYSDVINDFVKYVDKHLSDVTSQDVREFIGFRQSLGNASNSYLDTIRRYLSAFFNTICSEGYVQYNPMAKIKKIKSAKKVKKPFTELEIEKMRDALNSKPENTKTQELFKISDQALFELLLSSGIRLRECVQLNKEDIDLQNRTFTVLGKGNKERVCYFSVKCQYYLDKLLNFEYTGRTRKYEDCEALFVTKSSKGGYNHRIQHSGIERKIRNLGASCGVKAHPHKFRRTFATTLVRKGVPIEQIKELLGHSNIDTTMIYAIVDESQIRYNHTKYAG